MRRLIYMKDKLEIIDHVFVCVDGVYKDKILDPITNGMLRILTLYYSGVLNAVAVQPKEVFIFSTQDATQAACAQQVLLITIPQGTSNDIYAM